MAAASTSAFSRMSPRERALILIAGALALVISAIYLALLPGLDAARSAENRRARAASDLADVRALAASADTLRSVTQKLPEGDTQAAIATLAAESGLQLIEITASGADIITRLEASNSALVLDWIASVQARTGLGARAFSLSRGSAGTIVASVTFAGAST